MPGSVAPQWYTAYISLRAWSKSLGIPEKQLDGGSVPWHILYPEGEYRHALLALSHCRCLEDRIKIRDCRTKFTDRKLPSKLQQFIRCNREKFMECNGIKFVINQWKGMTEQFEINTSRSKGFLARGGGEGYSWKFSVGVPCAARFSKS